MIFIGKAVFPMGYLELLTLLGCDFDMAITLSECFV